MLCGDGGDSVLGSARETGARPGEEVGNGAFHVSLIAVKSGCHSVRFVIWIMNSSELTSSMEVLPVGNKAWDGTGTNGIPRTFS